MPNEMKPNQSFSPINQGPEAKPLHKRPDNSFVTVTLWTISGVVLAACSGGSNVIRDIGGDPADVPSTDVTVPHIQGADKESHFDDLLLISPTIEVDGAAIFRDLVAGVYQSENEDDYISFTEIILQFSAGSIYSHGRVSMPYMIIEFDEPVPYQEFKAIVGDKHNGGHNVITDFSLLDDLLGGDASFAYEVV